VRAATMSAVRNRSLREQRTIHRARRVQTAVERSSTPRDLGAV
jgi:hypothetical protein